MKWTNEQQSAIDTKNCKLLVAAGAGSGKTAVLVQRIIDKIVIDKIDIDKMLIVTFTNATASEMKERIRDGLYKTLETNPEIQKQLLLINRASIMTIDAFCKKVIKDNFFKLNLDPNFRVADSAENELLKLEALDEVLDALYEENDEKIIDVISAYSNNRSDDGLRSIILSIYNFIQSSPFPYEWLKEKCNMYDTSEIDFAKTIWGNEIIIYARKEIREIIDEMQELADDLQMNNDAKNYYLTLQDDLLILRGLYNCNTWDDFYEYISSVSIGSLKSAPKLDDETKEEVKEIREKMKGIVKKYLKEEIFMSTSKEIFEDIKKIHSNLIVLSDIVMKFDKLFKSKKHDKNIIDFSDMEHLCLELLNDNEDVANLYKTKFEEILIDEYQDSNLIQEFILNSISNGHMFMVGDVKQSIYRFRQARPELFLEKYETYSKNLSDDSSSKKILLFKNFRSNKNIIEQVNFIFQNIMSKDIGEIDYTDEECLKFGADYYLNEGVTAEIDLIEKSNKSEEEIEIEDDDIEDKPQLEGRVIAKRIEELVNNFEVYDKKTSLMRKARYSDIVILLRATKGYTDSFVQELSKRNIPTFADVNSGYFDNTEVQIVLSLLKIIDNPYQDIPLIAVMRSKIGEFTPDELTNIRLLDKNCTFYEAVKKSSKQGDEKSIRFIERLEKWREKSRHISLDELIWYLYEETGYYYYVSLLPDGKIRQANLKTLLDKATMYDKTTYRGLFNFINFLDNIKDSSGDMGSSKTIGENDNVVRIMSIHKSKGLEFPIVFLSGTARKFNKRDMSNPIILHQDYGFGADVIDNEKRIYYSSVPKLAIKLKSQKEALSEEMRILYVALTRAREKIIITALESNIEKKMDKWNKKISKYSIANSNNFVEWICKTVISKDANWDIRTWKYSDVLKLGKSDDGKVNQIATLLDNIDRRLSLTDEYKFIDYRLNWKYEYLYSTKVPTKVTVTELKRLNDIFSDNQELDISDMLEKPEFMKFGTETKISGNLYGTLVHNLMQRLDFEKPNIDIIVNNLDVDDDTKATFKEQLESFLRTNLYNEIKNAKQIHKEAPFNLEIPAGEIYEINDKSKDDILMVQGVIDIYVESEEGLLLVDYKTDRVNSETDLSTRYKKQLEYYKEALERLTNKKVVKMYIYSFHLKKEIEIL